MQLSLTSPQLVLGSHPSCLMIGLSVRAPVLATQHFNVVPAVFGV